jgi:hypothetical protein
MEEIKIKLSWDTAVYKVIGITGRLEDFYPYACRRMAL